MISKYKILCLGSKTKKGDKIALLKINSTDYYFTTVII